MESPPREVDANERAEFILFDLVSKAECETALLEILSGPSGRWWSSKELSECCEGYRRSCERWAPEAAEVAVTWLQHPDGGDDACLIIGYRELRSTTAFYNRHRLLEKLQTK